MLVFRLTKRDTVLARFISEQLAGTGAVPPSAAHLEGLLADDRCYLLAAVLYGNVIGYALAYRFPSLYESSSQAYLYDIDVLPAWRRRGAGRRLMETVQALLKSDGSGELWLGTATDNTAAQALFAATGGIRSGEAFYDYTFKLA